MRKDHSYKISAFGDFENITPTPENMMFFLEKFKDHGLMPSIFKEIKIDNIRPEPVANQRIGLLSNDSLEQIAITSNRIDYEVIIKNEAKIGDEEYNKKKDKICFAFKTIFDKFEKKSNRFALNTISHIVNLNDEEMTEFMSKYTNPISIYNGAKMEEWNTRLMVRQTQELNGRTEEFNIITNLGKTSENKQAEGILKAPKFFHVIIDINSIAENRSLRFNDTDISSFIGLSTTLWKKIISDIG